ncbi:MAG TPA: hypothetical protein V6C65_12425, partial [Allocoleopsis sp.]
MSTPSTASATPTSMEPPSPQDWSILLQQLLDGRSLETEQASTLMQGWLAEDIPPVLSGAILAAIQAKGVSASELAGMAQVLQSQSLGYAADTTTLPDT